MKKENKECADHWYRENFECINLWCEKNGYEVESNILLVPVLLPFFKTEDSLYEVQVKVKKIK